MLNHAGLWLALFAGFMGSAEEQTLRIPVFRANPNNEAFTSGEMWYTWRNRCS